MRDLPTEAASISLKWQDHLLTFALRSDHAITMRDGNHAVI